VLTSCRTRKVPWMVKAGKLGLVDWFFLTYQKHFRKTFLGPHPSPIFRAFEMVSLTVGETAGTCQSQNVVFRVWTLHLQSRLNFEPSRNVTFNSFWECRTHWSWYTWSARGLIRPDAPRTDPAFWKKSSADTAWIFRKFQMPRIRRHEDNLNPLLKTTKTKNLRMLPAVADFAPLSQWVEKIVIIQCLRFNDSMIVWLFGSWIHGHSVWSIPNGVAVYPVYKNSRFWWCRCEELCSVEPGFDS